MKGEGNALKFVGIKKILTKPWKTVREGSFFVCLKREIRSLVFDRFHKPIKELSMWLTDYMIFEVSIEIQLKIQRKRSLACR